MHIKNNSFLGNGSEIFYPINGEFGDGGGGLSRRRFLKRTGGATAASIISMVAANKAHADVGDHVSGASNRGSAGSFTQKRFRLIAKGVPEELQEVVSWMEDVPGANHQDVIITAQRKFEMVATGPTAGETGVRLTPIVGKVRMTMMPTIWFKDERTSFLEKDGVDYLGGWLEMNDSNPGPKMEKGAQDLPPTTNSMTLSVSGSSVIAGVDYSGTALKDLSTSHTTSTDKTEKWSSNQAGENSATSEQDAYDSSSSSASVGGSASSGLVKKDIGLTAELTAEEKENFSSKSSLSEKREYAVNSNTGGGNSTTYTVLKRYGLKVKSDVECHWQIRVQMQTRTVDIMTEKVTYESNWTDVNDDNYPDIFLDAEEENEEEGEGNEA